MLSQRIRKLYYKTLGTSVINNPLSPLYLCLNRLITAFISCQWWLLASYNAWGDYYDKAPNYGPEDDMYNEIDTFVPEHFINKNNRKLKQSLFKLFNSYYID